MSTDGRYMYHHGQGMAPTHYDYTPYPPPAQPPYDNTPIPQAAPVRPMRSNSASQPHSPHQQAQFHPPPSPYTPNYAPPAAYMTQLPPPPQPQWSGDNWTHNYGHSFHTQPLPAPPPESPYSGPGRPDAAPSSSTEASRGYSSIAAPPPNSEIPSRRIDERQAVAPPPNPPPTHQPKNRRQENESSPPVPAVSPGTPSMGLDFMKLLESYKLISTALSNGAPGPPSLTPDSMDRMLQASTYGAHMLDNAVALHQPPPPAPKTPQASPKEKPPEETTTKEPATTSSPQSATAPATKRQKGDETTQEGQTCLGCNATSTPEWRRGPLGPRTLCNACGLVYAKLVKKRVRDTARASGKSNGQGGSGSNSQGLDDSEGDSDDDDEYGSQGRRSEVGN